MSSAYYKQRETKYIVRQPVVQLLCVNNELEPEQIICKFTSWDRWRKSIMVVSHRFVVNIKSQKLRFIYAFNNRRKISLVGHFLWCANRFGGMWKMANCKQVVRSHPESRNTSADHSASRFLYRTLPHVPYVLTHPALAFWAPPIPPTPPPLPLTILNLLGWVWSPTLEQQQISVHCFSVSEIVCPRQITSTKRKELNMGNQTKIGPRVIFSKIGAIPLGAHLVAAG